MRIFFPRTRLVMLFCVQIVLALDCLCGDFLCYGSLFLYSLYNIQLWQDRGM